MGLLVGVKPKGVTGGRQVTVAERKGAECEHLPMPAQDAFGSVPSAPGSAGRIFPLKPKLPFAHIK